MNDAEQIAKAKGLKIWNGRGHGAYDRGFHWYVCAKSRAAAARLMQQVKGCEWSKFDSEIKNYYSEGCWGNGMRGVEPEPGVWAIKNYGDKPIRLV